MAIPRAPLASVPVLAAALSAAIPGPSPAVAPSSGCGAPATRLHAIQGRGGSSPLLGREGIVVEAVVVARFPGLPEGLGGFFVQEEDGDRDGDPRTSEGIFVFDGGRGDGLEVGERVRVRGRVGEFFGRTELFSVSEVVTCGPGGPASAVQIRLPLDAPSDWERWEGMRVRLEGPLVATGHRDLGRFGELTLAAGARIWQPTHRVDPGAPALALGARDARRRILLDDGSDGVDPEPTPHLERADGSTLRLGDSLGRLEGVLDFGFGRYRIHPTAPVRFEDDAPRPERPPRVDGTLRVAFWNVANHFNGDGRGGGFPTRGPRSALELERQRAKLVATLVRLDADVAALAEIENDGTGPDGTLAQLAAALNRHTPGPAYAVLDVGRPRLGGHAIAVGVLYRPAAAVPVGPPAVLDAAAHPGFDDARNRPGVAQTFRARATGQLVTVAVNHFKSKASGCDAAGDPDRGDGQGPCNATRERAARALAEWLATDPTGAGQPPVLVVGDLNAYPREDPVRALVSAGYADLLAWLAGADAHTHVFDGAAGRLDHALGGADLLRFVAGADVWHADADEPRLLGYRAASSQDRYAPDPFRASDHDPLLVGLFPDADADGLTDARDACPHSAPAPTVVLGDCDSGAAEHRDGAGCTLADRLLALRGEGCHRGRWLREAGRWLALRVSEGAITHRDRAAILACAARWDPHPRRAPGAGRTPPSRRSRARDQPSGPGDPAPRSAR